MWFTIWIVIYIRRIVIYYAKLRSKFTIVIYDRKTLIVQATGSFGIKKIDQIIIGETWESL